MSLFQWEHQLFCYNWLFYKCFSVPFCRNVLTRSGYWLLITQLNCLYCTTDFLALTWPDSFDTRVGFSPLQTKDETMWIVFKSTAKRYQLPVNWLIQLQSLNTLFVLTVNITSYESLIVYYCKYIWSLCKSSPYTNWNQRSVVPLPLTPTVPGLFYCIFSSPAECIWSTCEIWNK